ncbi:DUF3086 domain-containing protein [Synechococcus sp. CBW1002]|uniref:DUF3086 domain-containing protein n=2 Tax=unclassified Synechococcus TaxID=2626047 RepID=UPI00351C3A8E
MTESRSLPDSPTPLDGVPLSPAESPEAPEQNQTGEGMGIDEPAAGQETSVAGEPEPLDETLETLLTLALQDLTERRSGLEEEIRQLERRREQIQREIGSSFSGQSDAIARRLKGFQDYLVGALQDLVVAAEQVELVAQPLVVQPSPLDQVAAASATPEAPAAAPVAAAGLFSQDDALIRSRLDRYSGQPDFYADPWTLRRTLEAAQAALLEDWFLNQGGRGAQASAGSRSRNALIAGAAVSILGELYGERFQTLVLAGQPERLGEWRRGLQDCLGLGREDFGPNSGIVLFERADALIERADRLEERGELPFIVIDAAERVVEVPILQFPLWLAFAAGPGELVDDELTY